MKEVESTIVRLTKDLKQATATLGRDEARFLVDAYYMMQDERIRTKHQIRTLAKGDEPHAVLQWLFDNSETLEKQVKRALEVYALSHVVGQWALSITGVGPVISAGLLAHIDIHKAPTVGHIWRFAGLDPTVVWGKGQKRPWNASLKVLCWKIGESFVKVSTNENDIYGKVYVERKKLELANNEKGLYAQQAAQELLQKKYDKTKDSYKEYEAGRLPLGRIHSRAKRYAVKLFLAHWHHVAYEAEFGTVPPKPYVIEHLGHADFITPPNWPMV